MSSVPALTPPPPATLFVLWDVIAVYSSDHVSTPFPSVSNWRNTAWVGDTRTHRVRQPPPASARNGDGSASNIRPPPLTTGGSPTDAAHAAPRSGTGFQSHPRPPVGTQFAARREVAGRRVPSAAASRSRTSAWPWPQHPLCRPGQGSTSAGPSTVTPPPSNTSTNNHTSRTRRRAANSLYDTRPSPLVSNSRVSACSHNRQQQHTHTHSEAWSCGNAAA